MVELTQDTHCPACGAAASFGQRACRGCGETLVVELHRQRRTVGRYRLDREIARGGMGVVYAAYDERLERWVALKLLLGEFADDRDFRARFISESRAAVALDHPHILPVFDTGEADGILYIATRLVDGLDLRHHLAGSPILDLDRALTIAGQIAAALDYSHNRGLVHRDVTPGNILLVSEERDHPDHAYLIDFGITTSQSRDVRLTATGHFVGTPEYISPEQISQTHVDGRADQYALACVLYECVAGTSPFRRPTPVDVLHAHLHEDPPPPATLIAGLPPSVDAAIMRALSKDPARRFESCRAFINAARGSSGPVANRTDVETASRLMPDIAVEAPAQHRPVALLVLVLGLLVAAAGALAATQLPGRAGNGGATTSPATRTATPPRTATTPGPTLLPIDVRSLPMRRVVNLGYSVQLPAAWDITVPDEQQSNRPAGVSRRRTTAVEPGREVTLIVDAIANYDRTPEQIGTGLDQTFREDDTKPEYRQTSHSPYILGGDIAYQMAFRFQSGGRTVYNAEVILRRGTRRFAVLAYGQATTRDLADLARSTAGSIVIIGRPSPPPPPKPPPPPPPPSTGGRGTIRPDTGVYIGVGVQDDENGNPINTDTISIKFTKRHGVTIRYTKLGCRGRLYQVGGDPTRRIFTETIEAGTCKPGRWRIERLSSRAIDVTRTRRGETTPMTGTLHRDE